jgi:DNA-binding winged helix-turn-helix (wHTH) protein/predicted ATPase
MGESLESSGNAPRSAEDAGHISAFGDVRFNAHTGELQRDGRVARLTPKAAAVLTALLEGAPGIVTKEQLLNRVWGGRAISDEALTSCILELRRALDDDARNPRYIETRHRRGYRLMVPAIGLAIRGRLVSTEAIASEPVRLVGRAPELAELARCLQRARSGWRQVVFLTGEPGIGKSALANCFLEQLRAEQPVRIAHGQCLDQHGAGEPYLPLIEAVTRLAGQQGGPAVKTIFSAEAPSWAPQMPSLWTRDERKTLEARGQATRERMMREMTVALEAVASDVPLILKLEDIHWSDASTIDWLGHVARRPDPARLMILATFRPADAAAKKANLHALVTELVLHGCCREIELNPLSLEAIESYLKARLGEERVATLSSHLAPLLLDRTGGNPLFMSSIVNQLAHTSWDQPINQLMSIPHDVRRFIDSQIDELGNSDCDLLAAASVVRREFAAAAVAAALNVDVQEIEATCSRLARQGVFIVKGVSTTWPDGTLTERYSFRHDLHRQLLYDRLPATRRALSHARVGRRLEAAWTGQLEAIAAELAEHFELAGELVPAIPHHQRAAAKAMRRGANEEAIEHLRRALKAIEYIPDEAERTRIEVDLRVATGAAFIASKGYVAPEVLEAYTRAELLCDRLGERAEIIPAIWGQWLFWHGRGELGHARRLCARLLSLAESSGDASLMLQAHHANWPTLFLCGELIQAHRHASAGLRLYDPKIHRATASSYGNHDACACAYGTSAMVLGLQGKNEDARATIEAGLRVAMSLDDPFSLALTLYPMTAAAQLIGDVALATTNSEWSVRIAREHGLAQFETQSGALAGWCAVENGERDRGLALLTEATDALRAMQSLGWLSYLLGLLCDARIKAGQPSEAMKAVEEAISLVEVTGERFYSAELYRLRGELLAQASIGQSDEAKAEFNRAVQIAAQQGAVSLERKARDSLRLHRFG